MYHCMARCVRRAFLCGFDHLSRQDFEHRKEWVRERLRFLTTIFTLDVLAYAVMSNHLHVLLRTCHAALEALSDREVARRWLLLYPARRHCDGTPCEPEEVEIAVLVNKPEAIKRLRERLGNISWFMKSLDEYLARRANQEDGSKGRFWEGRFKCQRIASEAAALQCAIYIDLNPIRAKIAETPEESFFTSAWERIEARSAKLELESQSLPGEQPEKAETAATTAAVAAKHAALQERAQRDCWLAPIQSTDDRQGFLSITLDQYLSLLDWTGRQLREDKRGAIPHDLAPILERLRIDADHWVDSTQYHKSWFSRFVGNVNEMTTAAAAAGKQWFRGMAAARKLFLAAAAA